jgi:type II secretory pathway pseudopilin PulG
MERLRQERAFVLPTAMAMLFIIGVLVAATASVALTANSQAGRDQNVKEALAAADSGVRAAAYRINVLEPGPLQCVKANSPTGDLSLTWVAADGWCPAQVEELPNGASYSYRVSSPEDLVLNGQYQAQRKIVSTGIVGGVERRVLALVNAATGAPLFASGKALVGADRLDLSNSARVDGSAASNGDIYLDNSAIVCGDATPGDGKQVITSNHSGLCPGFSSQPSGDALVLEPVDQGSAATSNDNARIGTQDTWTSSGQIEWNPTARSLKLKNNSTLTLGGNLYSFCHLEITNNAQLIIAARDPGTAVRIYIDAPENCGSTAGAGSVSLTNAGSIVNLNADPTTLQLYVVGSDSASTSVSLQSNPQAAFNLVIYAPRSTVSVNNQTRIVGAIAGKRASVDNNSSITWNDKVAQLRTGSLLSIFKRQRWIECTTKPPSATPDSGC